MSEADEKRDRIRSRIEASQERLHRESEQLPAIPSRRAPADAAEAEHHQHGHSHSPAAGDHGQAHFAAASAHACDHRPAATPSCNCCL